MRCCSRGFSSMLLLVAVAAAQPVPTRPAIRTLPAERLSRMDQLHASLQPAVRKWVEAQARLALQRPAPDLTLLRASVQQRFPSLGAAGPAASSAAHEALLQLVLRKAYLQATGDLQNCAKKTERFNQMKQALRGEVDQLRQELARQGSQPKTALCASAYSRSLPSRLANLNALSASSAHPLHLQPPANPTYADLHNVIADLTAKMDTVGDDAQMANVDMQSALQQQQQALQVLSNISKEINDTDMAVIRKIGG